MINGKTYFLLCGALFALLILIEFASAEWMDLDRDIFRQKRGREVDDELGDNEENVNPLNQFKKGRKVPDIKLFEENQTPAIRPRIVIRRKGMMCESNLNDIKVLVATDGNVLRSPKQAEIFKTAVEEKSMPKGISDTFVLTGQSCANGLGNLYKK